MVLGAGGLGSWVAPLIAQGIEPLFGIRHIDSDLFVESHNLNRQVLYSEEDTFSKGPSSKQKIRKIIKGFKSINGIVGKKNTM